jgi:hypothetical protein
MSCQTFLTVHLAYVIRSSTSRRAIARRRCK